MNITIKTFPAARAWAWIAAGIAIFRKAPSQWLLLIAILFAGSRVLYAIPLLGVMALLTAPNFLAGLWHGTQALESGKPLRPAYLISGFLKNASRLITIGGISLVGKFLAIIAVLLTSGEALNAITHSAGGGAMTDEAMDAMRAARPSLMLGLLAGLVVSLPFVMAAWFAPLLVFFDNLKAAPSLMLSLRACAQNALPLLLYALAVVTALMVLMPFGLVLRQPDLGLWLLAPVLVPSIYASYLDIFKIEPDAAPQPLT